MVESQFLKLLLGTDRVQNPEDVDILGKLSSKTLSTGGIEITVIDPEAKTIGTAIILPQDGLNDGKSVIVKTKAVKADSKIFVTANRPVKVAVTQIIDGMEFLIETDPVVTQELKVNWWIIESSGQ